MASASDVPNKYDIVIDGVGYCYAREIQPNLPFRTQRAKYSFSPTFVTRQNVSGNYGDDQQDFWLTFVQNDWSGGAGQEFARPNDEQSKSRFRKGRSIDISVAGQVSMAKDQITSWGASMGENNFTAIGATTGLGSPYDNTIYVGGTTHLRRLSAAGVASDLGAHGAGQPFIRGMASDVKNIYIAGATSIRAYAVVAGTFSTFSAGVYNSICFAANTMYGMQNSDSATFGRFDTAGTFTSIYVFKDAAGNTNPSVTTLRPDGSHVFVLRTTGENGQGSQLWEYDGVGLAPVAEFPPNFTAGDMEVVEGIVFVAGTFVQDAAGTTRPAIYYYANGTSGLLWKAIGTTASTTVPALCAFKGGLVFSDESSGDLTFYDPDTGAISPLVQVGTGSFVFSSTSGAHLAAGGTAFFYCRSASQGNFFPTTSATTPAYVDTSFIDFDSSLTKRFRGITVEFDQASDGDGGSVDIAYKYTQAASAPPTSFTTLATAAVSGQEYLLEDVVGHAIQVHVTLNRSASTNGPVLKRLYVRAAPILQSFRNDEIIISCEGRDGKNPVMLNNGNPHNLDGLSLATTLRGVITETNPVQISDRFGTFTGVILPETAEIIEVRPEEYLARFQMREV